MDILQKFLDKKGVKNFFELNHEEKETYRQWENILSGRKLTDDDVKSFLDNELEDAINKVTSKKFRSRPDTFLKVKIEFIRNVKRFLESPEVAKKVLEENIRNQI